MFLSPLLRTVRFLIVTQDALETPPDLRLGRPRPRVERSRVGALAGHQLPRGPETSSRRGGGPCQAGAAAPSFPHAPTGAQLRGQREARGLASADGRLLGNPAPVSGNTENTRVRPGYSCFLHVRGDGPEASVTVGAWQQDGRPVPAAWTGAGPDGPCGVAGAPAGRADSAEVGPGAGRGDRPPAAHCALPSKRSRGERGRWRAERSPVTGSGSG